MSTRHFSNLATTTPQTQAQVMYHWLTFVNPFPLVEANSAVPLAWSTTTYAGVSGYVASLAPSSFYDASAPFVAGHLGQYIAVRDDANPDNCLVSKITGVVSPTELSLDVQSANFTLDATDLSYIIFDPAVAPVSNDFFVLQSPITTGPQWQVKCTITATPELSWEFGYLGGWDVGTSTWLLPVSPTNYSHSTVARTFCTTDSAAGYFYTWSEDTGGAGSMRNAVWAGTLSPFHSPVESGVPKDTSYSAIFGSETSGTASNVSRSTAVSDNISVGSSLDASGLPTSLYIAQKTLLSSGVDLMSLATAATNPRSLQIDDYDAIVLSTLPGTWRGRLPGVRILNSTISNRAPINSNLSYVLGDGIGSVWNGKTIVP